MGPSLFCQYAYYEYNSNLCNNVRVAVVYPLVFYDYDLTLS